jgi:polysaccharide export outer membrane protein
MRLTAYVFIVLLTLASPSAAAGADYRIHAGDVLNVQVFGESTLSQATIVLSDGSIVYPLIGRQNVVGKTLSDVDGQITRALYGYMHDPIVSVSVTSEGQLNILVFGNVKTPGKYVLSADSRLTDAIAAAGGIGTIEREYPSARLSIGSQALQTIPLQKLLRDGDLTLNVPLQNNTVVYVPTPSSIRVRVIGAVDKPGDIDIEEGDHLSMAVAKAGASTNSNPDLNRVHVTRTGPTGAFAGFEVNLYRELQQGDMRSDPVLQKGDIVFVPQARRHDSGGAGVLSALRSIFIPY